MVCCFNPHPLITVDATGRVQQEKRFLACFNPHPLITVDATRKKSQDGLNILKFQSSSTDHSGCNSANTGSHVTHLRFNPHPLITVDATVARVVFVEVVYVSILIH